METKTSVIKELDTNQDTRRIEIGVQLCMVRMFITNLKSTLKIRLRAHIFPRTFADLLPLCYDYNTKH